MPRLGDTLLHVGDDDSATYLDTGPWWYVRFGQGLNKWGPHWGTRLPNPRRRYVFPGKDYCVFPSAMYPKEDLLPIRREEIELYPNLKR